jgi:integrase
VKIADLIDQYELGAKLRGVAPTQLMALRPIRRGLGHLAPSRLTPSFITNYDKTRRQGMWTASGRHAADGTIRRELGALSAVLNWAHQKRLLKDAPPTIDLPPASPPREVFLTVAEADVLFEDAAMKAQAGSRVGLFVCLALDTWARANAVETLPWSRVNGHIDYRDPARPETSKRRVPVPISTRLGAVLADARRQHERNCGVLSCPVVGRITQYEWKRWLGSTIFKDRGLTRHDLRRTGISSAVARGVDLMKVAQAAGDNYDTILRHYARFSPSYLDGVME